jgi:hypothetical protein
LERKTAQAWSLCLMTWQIQLAKAVTMHRSAELQQALESTQASVPMQSTQTLGLVLGRRLLPELCLVLGRRLASGIQRRRNWMMEGASQSVRSRKLA